LAFVHYEQLDCYRLAFDLAVRMHKLSLDFPKIEQYGGLADQLRRSSKSICANMAEGLSKHMSAADERRFLSLSLGSAEESRVWISFAVELGYVTPEQGQALKDEFERVCRMVYGLQQKRDKVAA